jgi:hypothetical protein
MNITVASPLQILSSPELDALEPQRPPKSEPAEAHIDVKWAQLSIGMDRQMSDNTATMDEDLLVWHLLFLTASMQSFFSGKVKWIKDNHIREITSKRRELPSKANKK